MSVVPARPPDRRQRKSRAALRRALLHVIRTKPYDGITIEDITEAADVTRATFYAHYPDKTALLREAYEELISELTPRVAALAPVGSNVYTGAVAAEIFRHAGEHPDLYLVVITGSCGAAPRAVLFNALQALATDIFSALTEDFGCTPRVPLSFATGNLIAAALYTLERWLVGDLEGTPAEMAALFMRAQVGGLEWALGLEPGGLEFQPPAG